MRVVVRGGSCSGGSGPGGIFPGVFIRGGSCPGGNYPGGSCPYTI